jgi:3-oxoacyl-[acyl-carrier-protein] synthase-1
MDDAVADMPIVLQRQDDKDLNTIMTNNFGFGGTNACLVLQKIT